MIAGYPALLVWGVFVLYLGTILHVLTRLWWVFGSPPKEADDPRFQSCIEWLGGTAVALCLGGFYLVYPVPDVASHSAVAGLPTSVGTILAWSPLALGIWGTSAVVLHGVNAYGAPFLHEGKKPEEIAWWAIRRTGLGWGVYAIPLAFFYLVTVHFGSIPGAFVGATSHILVKKWKTTYWLLDVLDVRDPTAEEAERIRSRLGDEIVDRYSISIYEVDPDTPIGDVLASPIGVPGRRRFLVGDALVYGDDETVDASWAVTRVGIDTRFLDYHVLARTIRACLLAIVAVLVAPFVAPTPPLPMLGGAILASVLVIGAVDYWIRRRAYDLDRRAAREVGAVAVAELLATCTRVRFESRFSKHQYLHPSVGDRVEALHAAVVRR